MDCDIYRLWERAKEDDSDAWRQVVRLYSGLINTVARRAGLSSADAEDCVQHVWMILYRKRRNLKDPRALPAWLIKTTHRHAVASARRLKPDARDLLAVAPPASEELPDEVIIQLEHQAILDYALKQLDPKCRRLLEALFYSPRKQSYRAIAKDLNVLPNSLGPLRVRCLKKLREILQNLGYERD
ncbi:MAG: sigma-70 family RNA polymerase sigma factor [candidate division Zixibacteria bacterium]|nr:sigma-70 family RNA polymerase sigma factor [candidate division Zixibacteria bacterium]